MRDGSKVALAGGGVAGLATALAFRKAGYEVTVIERTAVLDTVGAGILLQANGLLVLDALGLGDEVRAAGAAMPRFQLKDRSGRTLLAIELQAHLPRALWPLCIHRADLHVILWRACVAAGATLNSAAKSWPSRSISDRPRSSAKPQMGRSASPATCSSARTASARQCAAPPILPHISGR